MAAKRAYSTLDRWMLSRLNTAIQAATTAMERLRVREVVNIVLYHLENDAAWYQRRLGPKKTKGDARNQVLRQVFDSKARMLAPLAPHVADEMWFTLGNKGLVVRAEWPKPDDRFHDKTAEASESIVKQTLEDTGEILKATGLTAKSITYYAAGQWKLSIYQKALTAAQSDPKRQGEFIKEIMSDPKLRAIGKPAADYAAKSYQQATQMKEELRESRVGVQPNEKKVLEDASDFFRREFRAEIHVSQEGEKEIRDPKGRSRFAEPYRPAIFIE